MKRKALLAVVFFSALVEGATGHAQAACESWDLADDWTGTNPIIDTCGKAVWYLQHQVPDSVLPGFPLAPGYYPLTNHHPYGRFPAIDMFDVDPLVSYSDFCSEDICLPNVGKNTSAESWPVSPYLTVPGDTVTFHPSPAQRAVVAWQSPFTGCASVQATFTLLDSSSNGVNCYVSKNNTGLASGLLAPLGSSSYTNPCLAVSTGTLLYFSVDSNDEVYGDTTGISVTIAAAAGMNVAIDIKPDSATNSINLKSKGVIPVAIFSTADFSAPDRIRPETISLAGARVKRSGKSNKYQCHSEDVNQDGLTDLLCQVNTAEFMIAPGESLAVLEAETYDGLGVIGEDTVKIVPKAKTR